MASCNLTPAAVQTTTRGGMLHLVLQLCRQFEDAFAKCVDGGKGGGEVILQVCCLPQGPLLFACWLASASQWCVQPALSQTVRAALLSIALPGVLGT